MAENWTTRFAANMTDYAGYPIGKLLKMVADPEIISLAAGLPAPELFLKEDVRRLSERHLQDEIETIMQYAGVPGEPRLIAAVRDYLTEDDIRLDPEQILITTSAQQGLDLCGRLFLNPGDGLIVDRPTFSGAISAFQLQPPVFGGVDLEADGSDVEGIEEKILSLRQAGTEPKFIYAIPEFQNPSGITMSLSKREALLDVSYRHGIPIVEDSPYRHLRFEGENSPPLFSLDQKRDGDHVIGVYTFSKLFSPGMRVGFNIGPAEVIDNMINIKEGNTLFTPTYNQEICADFLTVMDREAFFRRSRERYSQKLAVLLAALEEFFPPGSGATWTRPAGGMFVWMTLPPEIDTMELFHEAVRHKVVFVPSEAFYGENPARNHMRLNFSYPDEADIREGIRRLAESVKDLQ